jgi:hypothetical protein
MAQEFFTVKPAATFFIRPNPLVAKTLPDTTGVRGDLPIFPRQSLYPSIFPPSSLDAFYDNIPKIIPSRCPWYQGISVHERA